MKVLKLILMTGILGITAFMIDVKLVPVVYFYLQKLGII
ncbi:MAG: hypothetical protein H6Q39_416 [Chloroflexi bacterium]|jgi:hypothetical protein|nr:hypothetical protein [Chloroflexota bacterium]